MTTLIEWAVFAGIPTFAAGLGFLLATIRHRPELWQARAELAEARHAAEHDAVTGLPNRVGLQRHQQRLIAAGSAPAAVLLDLDDFKSVNDTWGHAAGDGVLTAVAHRLAEGCGPLGAVAGRLAGDEFLLLLPGVTEHDALEVVRTLIYELGKPITLPAGDGSTFTVRPTASAGIALPGPRRTRTSTWSDLVRRADVALYHAKLNRGHAVLHTSGMRQPARDVDVSGRMRDRSRHPVPTVRGVAGSAMTQMRAAAWAPTPPKTILYFTSGDGCSDWSQGTAAGRHCQRRRSSRPLSMTPLQF